MHFDWSMTIAHCRGPAVELEETCARLKTRVAVMAPAPTAASLRKSRRPVYLLIPTSMVVPHSPALPLLKPGSHDHAGCKSDKCGQTCVTPRADGAGLGI